MLKAGRKRCINLQAATDLISKWYKCHYRTLQSGHISEKVVLFFTKWTYLISQSCHIFLQSGHKVVIFLTKWLYFSQSYHISHKVVIISANIIRGIYPQYMWGTRKLATSMSSTSIHDNTHLICLICNAMYKYPFRVLHGKSPYNITRIITRTRNNYGIRIHNVYVQRCAKSI